MNYFNQFNFLTNECKINYSLKKIQEAVPTQQKLRNYGYYVNQLLDFHISKRFMKLTKSYIRNLWRKYKLTINKIKATRYILTHFKSFQQNTYPYQKVCWLTVEKKKSVQYDFFDFSLRFKATVFPNRNFNCRFL